MNFFKDLDIRYQAILISAFLGFLATILNIFFTNKSQSKRRYIDAISVQRIEWINNLRNKFVEFNELVYKRKLLLNSSNSIISDDENQMVKSKLLDKNAVKLFSVESNIELFLNPTEFFSGKLSKYLNEIIDIFAYTEQIENNPLFKELDGKVNFIEQVILKSEWNRINKETEIGKKINKYDMADIFNETAIKIDSKIYSSFKSGTEWKNFEKLLSSN